MSMPQKSPLSSKRVIIPEKEGFKARVTAYIERDLVSFAGR